MTHNKPIAEDDDDDDDDDDRASISAASSAGKSVFSVASMATSVTNLSASSGYTASQIIAAADMVVKMLFEHKGLQPLYKSAIECSSIGPDRFARNFRRLLKIYSGNLEEEAEDHLEFLAARLVGLKARYVANSILRTLRKPGRPSRAPERDEDSSSDEEQRPVINADTVGDIASTRGFLLRSDAFVTLQKDFCAFVAAATPDAHRKSKSGLGTHQSTNMQSFGKAQGTEMSSSVFASLLQRVDAVFRPLWPIQPPCHPSKHRVTWQCQCGRQFFSDLSELKSGAIKRLEDHLERSTNATIIRATSNRGNTSSNGMCQSFMAWAQTTARSFKGWFRRRRGPALPQHNAKPIVPVHAPERWNAQR
ncbi:hypothetical protein B0J12DRAFT_323297 [Macrophomina phaseolina]|uniref:Uncharacterized protein n=1 Tax=Macrophomina phaseolina TaxID=35725 RepID=A0ABQ8FVP7_9PEZI|nr:hypothetical protein B0J12DRAFT_323297 [Macrophomina phaseolina]